jgi:hypothetical protein
MAQEHIPKATRWSAKERLSSHLLSLSKPGYRDDQIDTLNGETNTPVPHFLGRRHFLLEGGHCKQGLFHGPCGASSWCFACPAPAWDLIRLDEAEESEM